MPRQLGQSEDRLGLHLRRDDGAAKLNERVGAAHGRDRVLILAAVHRDHPQRVQAALQRVQILRLDEREQRRQAARLCNLLAQMRRLLLGLVVGAVRGVLLGAADEGGERPRGLRLRLDVYHREQLDELGDAPELDRLRAVILAAAVHQQPPQRRRHRLLRAAIVEQPHEQRDRAGARDQPLRVGVPVGEVGERQARVRRRLVARAPIEQRHERHDGALGLHDRLVRLPQRGDAGERGGGVLLHAWVAAAEHADQRRHAARLEDLLLILLLPFCNVGEGPACVQLRNSRALADERDER